MRRLAFLLFCVPGCMSSKADPPVTAPRASGSDPKRTIALDP